MMSVRYGRALPRSAGRRRRRRGACDRVFGGGLVGRGAEVEVAAAAVTRLAEGRSSVLVIAGEPASARPAWSRASSTNARSHDVAVFSGQAHPFERARPLGVVAAALQLTRRSP